MRTIKKLFDAPRIRDVVSLRGPRAKKGTPKMTMPDGSPVTVEHIMAAWGVDRVQAEKVVKANA